MSTYKLTLACKKDKYFGFTYNDGNCFCCDDLIDTKYSANSELYKINRGNITLNDVIDWVQLIISYYQLLNLTRTFRSVSSV